MAVKQTNKDKELELEFINDDANPKGEAVNATLISGIDENKNVAFDMAFMMAEFEKMQKKIDDLENEKKNATVNSSETILANILKNNTKAIEDLSANSKDEKVKIIHLYDVHRTALKLSDQRIIAFEKYGEVRPVDLSTAEMLLNQYSKCFEKGGLTLDADHLYLLEERGIDHSTLNLDLKNDMKKINKLNKKEIEDFLRPLKPFQTEILKGFVINSAMADKSFITLAQLRLINTCSKTIVGTQIIKKGKDGIEKKTIGGYESIIKNAEEYGIED